MGYLQILTVKIIVIIAAAFLCAGVTIKYHMARERRLFQKLKQRRRRINRRKLRKRTTRRTLVSLARIFGVAGIAIWLAARAPVAEASAGSSERTRTRDTEQTVNLVQKLSLRNRKKEVSVVEDVFAEENAEVLKLFEEDVFSTLSDEQKKDALRSVMELELAYLGCGQVRLDIREIDDDSCLGYYKHSQRRIVLNERRVLRRSGMSCLKVLFHEIYHAYQHQCIDKLKKENIDSSLKVFREIDQWEYETRHYISAGEESTVDEWERYRTQTLELSADEYAEQRAQEYGRYYESLRD